MMRSIRKCHTFVLPVRLSLLKTPVEFPPKKNSPSFESFFSSFFSFQKSRTGRVTFPSRRAVMTRAGRKDMQMNRLTITIDHCRAQG